MTLAPSANESRHRRSYAEDPGLCDRVFDLLGTWLPVLPRMRRRAAAWGWRWEDVSTPFVHERGGRVISHVGVLEMELVCHGRVRRVGGIHAVCTLESERGRGLYRSLMEEALAWCDERYPTLELTTEHPEYYEPFGFVHVPEARFRAELHSNGGRQGLRRLDPNDAEDLAVIDDLLERRAPVSRGLGVVREHAVFKFNLAGGVPLYHCETLDLLAAMSWNPPGELVLHDLVAEELPRMEDLLAQIGKPVREVSFEFRPEKLGVAGLPERITDDWLMVRGEFPYAECHTSEYPLGALSPLARH
jgi:GNAT superfamily N-acetyltransferase